MLHPKAVEAFLDEDRDSHVWVKGLGHKKLDAALYDLGFRPISPEPLDLHQKACILLGIAYPQFSFWLDMGTGKTRIVLELLNYFWCRRKITRVIICVTSDQAVAGWEDEIVKWGFKVPFMGIGNSATAEKWQSVAELGAGVIIATYPSLNYMFGTKKKTGKGKTKMKPDLPRIKSFSANMDGFVADESVHIGNHRSLGYQIAKRLTFHCFLRYNLAGIPFGRDPTLVWAQQYIVDRGESLGDTLGMFRAAFFTEKRGFFGGFDYKYRKEMEPDLSRMMQHRSICYATDECLDLPKVTTIERSVKLPEETLDYLATLKKALKEARGNKQQIENIFLRMRQMSSGWVGYKDGDEKAQIMFRQNPKLDDLLDRIEDMPFNSKFVIFHEFIISGKLVMEGLAKRGIKAGWLWSGTSNGRKLKKRFDNDDPDKFKGLLVNNHLGAESLNLQRANYLHFFESPVPVIARGQAERRTFRKGQTKPGFLYDYFAVGADRRIRQWHREGGNLLQAIVRDRSLLD